jgi:hypothetical protein
MKKTSMCAYIMFRGNDDFPIDVVTNRLNVQPTNTWKIGERVVRRFTVIPLSAFYHIKLIYRESPPNLMQFSLRYSLLPHCK